jgi:hypothetical protein
MCRCVRYVGAKVCGEVSLRGGQEKLQGEYV